MLTPTDESGNVKLRVKDYLFDAEDNPIVDSETGRHLRNNLAYHFARKSYYPGEEILLPADVAQAALKPYGPRPRIIEPASEHAARQARLAARAAASRNVDRDGIDREMRQLDQQAGALLRMRQLAHEREMAELSQRAPGAMAAHAMHLMDRRIADSERREATALGEAPPDLLARLEKLEQAAQAERAAREAAEQQLAELRAAQGAPAAEGPRRGKGG